MVHKKEAKVALESSRHLYELAAQAKKHGNLQQAQNYRRAARAKAKEAKAKLRLAREAGEFGVKENAFDEQAREATKRAYRLKRKGRVAASEEALKQAAEHRAMAANLRKYGTIHAPTTDPGADHEAAAEELRQKARALRLDKSEEHHAEARAKTHDVEAEKSSEEAKVHRAEGREMSAKAAEDRAKGHRHAAEREREKAAHARVHGRAEEADAVEKQASAHEETARTARDRASSGYADPKAHNEEVAAYEAEREKRRKAVKETAETARKLREEKAEKIAAKKAGKKEKIDRRREYWAMKKAERIEKARRTAAFRQQFIGDYYTQGRMFLANQQRKRTLAKNRAEKEKKAYEAEQEKVRKAKKEADSKARAEKRRAWLAKVFYKVTGRKFPAKKLSYSEEVQAQAEIARKAKSNIKANHKIIKMHRQHLKNLKAEYKKLPKGERAHIKLQIEEVENNITDAKQIVNEHKATLDTAQKNLKEIHEKEAARLPNRVRAKLSAWNEKYQAFQAKRAAKKEAKAKAKAEKTAKRNEKIADFTNKLLGKFGFDLIPPSEEKKTAVRHIEGGMAGWGTFAQMAYKGIRPPDPAEIIKQEGAKNGPPGELHKGKKGGIFYYDAKGKKVYIDQMNVGKWKIKHSGNVVGKIYSMYKAYKAGKHGARLYH